MHARFLSAFLYASEKLCVASMSTIAQYECILTCNAVELLLCPNPHQCCPRPRPSYPTGSRRMSYLYCCNCVPRRLARQDYDNGNIAVLIDGISLAAEPGVTRNPAGTQRVNLLSDAITFATECLGANFLEDLMFETVPSCEEMNKLFDLEEEPAAKSVGIFDLHVGQLDEYWGHMAAKHLKSFMHRQVRIRHLKSERGKQLNESVGICIGCDAVAEEKDSKDVQ